MILILNIFITEELKAGKERYENEELSNDIKNNVDNKGNSVINRK